ncbi:hypothetical protein LTV02_23925 [Nocardia yamanashiensis]|uniref:hypothetical protein n=1 Tax=Nocardia yamanashiensis TaxID=209247 RepID=UPI001E3FE14C|nr:hypothetical protein [Nocardia yamanashiensis]UGT39134.1 hypothetical protein LTV02_23925 [Nocardia yamanashiensis]
MDDRADAEPFLLEIDSAFTITGRGTYVIGEIRRGTLKIGDRVWLTTPGGGIETRVLGIEFVNRRPADPGEPPPALVGLKLEGIEKRDAEAGQQVTAIPPGSSGQFDQ